MKTIKQQLKPRIINLGIRNVARAAGIPSGNLSDWLSDAVRPGRNRPRRMNDHQIDAIASAVGCQVVVSMKGKTR
tara:strand:+ start:253 stop:477 length:225 start_codon:yes stop_codon:yes gene_type:complete